MLAEKVVALREQALGPEHPDTSTSFNYLAELYRAMGAYAKAEPLLQRALGIVAGGTVARPGESRGHRRRPAAPLRGHLYGKAVNTIQGLRGQAASLDKALQRSFLADKAAVYRTVAERLSSQSRYAEALETLLLLKQDEHREYLVDLGDALRDQVTFTGSEIEWNGAYQDVVARLAPIRAEESPNLTGRLRREEASVACSCLLPPLGSEL